MKTINLFCLIGKTDAGQNEYLSEILSDLDFVHKTQIEKLIFNTTRKKEDNEINRKDYNFTTLSNYSCAWKTDMIDFSDYSVLSHQLDHYYILREDIDRKENCICAIGPRILENIISWAQRRNEETNSNTKYCIAIILVNMSVKNRLERKLQTLNNEKDIVDYCAAIVQDRTDFNECTNAFSNKRSDSKFKVCYIDNNNLANFKANTEKIRQFIQATIEENEK